MGMDEATHRMAVLVGTVAVGIGYLGVVAGLIVEALRNDGVIVDHLVQFGLLSLLILAVLLLGAPVVLSIVQALGLHFGGVSISLPVSPDPSVPSQSEGQSAPVDSGSGSTTNAPVGP